MTDWYECEKKRILSSQPEIIDLHEALVTDVTKKRALYKCGDNFKTLEQIEKYSEKISLLDTDITTLEIDCIINGANEGLLGGGGLDEAIHTAAGPFLQRECANLDLCMPGKAVITKGYKLPATYVIHTVAPYFDDENNPQPLILKECYESIFKLVSQYRIRSVAIPPIGTGFYGFPKDAAAKIATEAALNFLTENEGKIDRIIFTAAGKSYLKAFDEFKIQKI